LKRHFRRPVEGSVCQGILYREMPIEMHQQDYTDKRLAEEFVQDKITRFVKDISRAIQSRV